MNLKNKLFASEDDNRGVSPVIGVILMVAITVILAAVIAAAVMGMGEGLGETAPTAGTNLGVDDTWDTKNGGDIFYLSHQTGDSIAGEEIRVVVRETSTGAAVIDLGPSDSWEDTTAPGEELDLDGDTATNFGDGEFGGGSTITITDNGDGASAGTTDLAADTEYTVQLIHVPSDTTVAEHTAETPA